MFHKVFLGLKLLVFTQFCLIRKWTKSFASHQYRRYLLPVPGSGFKLSILALGVECSTTVLQGRQSPSTKLYLFLKFFLRTFAIPHTSKQNFFQLSKNCFHQTVALTLWPTSFRGRSWALSSSGMTWKACRWEDRTWDKLSSLFYPTSNDGGKKF